MMKSFRNASFLPSHVRPSHLFSSIILPIFSTVWLPRGQTAAGALELRAVVGSWRWRFMRAAIRRTSGRGEAATPYQPFKNGRTGQSKARSSDL